MQNGIIKKGEGRDVRKYGLLNVWRTVGKMNGCRIYVDILTGEKLSSIQFDIFPISYWLVW